MPAPVPTLPYPLGSDKIAPKTSLHTVGASRRLRKPGPATSTLSTRLSAVKRVINFSAISRGSFCEGLANTIAAFVAISPCAASRGGSTVTASKLRPSDKSPCACMRCKLSRTRLRISAKRFISLSQSEARV